jgi:hypothetical protein
MDFDDLIAELAPPPNRQGKAKDGHEQRFYEGAVMLAYAMHLLETEDAKEVRVHPDGMHGKQFDFSGWLRRHGFTQASNTGRTTYGGTYIDHAGRTIVVNPKSGQGDIVAKIGNTVISAECKGGIINSRHAGALSKLYRGLCETVGLLMATPSPGRQVAVVPYTEKTLRLAERLAPRCAKAGIEIALVKSRGEVIDVRVK